MENNNLKKNNSVADNLYIFGDDQFLVKLQNLESLKLKSMAGKSNNNNNRKIDLFTFLAKHNPGLMKILDEILEKYDNISEPPNKSLLKKILSHPQYQPDMDLNRAKKVLLVHELVHKILVTPPNEIEVESKHENYMKKCKEALRMLNDL